GLNQMLKDILNWVIQKNIIPPTPQLKDVNANLTTYVLPFLECMKVFDYLGFSSYKDGDILVQDFLLSVKDLS
ncbi:MAG: hypothetical protein JW774_08675, partial [Candidatus Aureabacteria bacterium]|nr:hypothetical protein [Candidatus Auribacterota bacterium]